MKPVYDMSPTRQLSDHASLRSHRFPQSIQSIPFQLPRQSLDDSEDGSDFDKMISHGLRKPTIAMGKWLCGLPSVEDLDPNEHFAIGEYDDESGFRRSAMFVYERADDKQQYEDPRTPPMPPIVSNIAFAAHDYLNSEPPQDKPQHHSFFKIGALSSVESGKIVLKRLVKTANRVLEQFAIMPDHSGPQARTSGPTISLPYKQERKQATFDTISIQEAQAREQARRTNYLKQAAKRASITPLEIRRVGKSSRTTLGDFLIYQTPPVSDEQISQPKIHSPTRRLSSPRVPERINLPSRKPLPARGLDLNLDKSLPSTPDTDSLRRRTQMPLGVLVGKQPEILTVPARKAILTQPRKAIMSQHGLVLENCDASYPEVQQEERNSWPGTPVNSDFEPREQPLWWQFEASTEELDPTQAVWVKMEEDMRSGGRIRVAPGRSQKARPRQGE